MDDIDATLSGYVTVAEMARLTGLTENTIRHHCRTGRLPAIGLGNTWLIPKADAVQFILRRGLAL